MANLVHCSHDHYHLMPLDELDVFAGGVKLGFYGNNPPFVTQPLTLLAFTGLIGDFNTTRAAYKVGGLAQRTPFRLAKAALLLALDQIADAVDEVALGDGDTITLSGNFPTDGSKTKATKPGQAVVTIKRGLPLEIITNCEKVEGAKHYGCLLLEHGPISPAVQLLLTGQLHIDPTSAVPPPPPPIPTPPPDITGLYIDLNDQREKHFINLKHDVEYWAYYFVINSAGVGILSEGVSIVCW